MTEYAQDVSPVKEAYARADALLAELDEYPPADQQAELDAMQEQFDRDRQQMYEQRRQLQQDLDTI